MLASYCYDDDAPAATHDLCGGFESDECVGLESDTADGCSWQDEFAKLEAELGLEPPVEVTAVEVAGRRCIDLNSRRECKVLQTMEGGAKVPEATSFVATSAGSLAAYLQRMLNSRTTEATAANATSSRSHALLRLRILRTETGGPTGVGHGGAHDGARGGGGVLTLLDCAGSEWAADSDAHGAQRRREGAEINASLHALKQCVRARAEKLRAEARGGTYNGHVPYREATLTRLLRESFETDGARDGASSVKLAMVGCISPGAADTEHSISTLRTIMELGGATGEECTTTTQDVPRLRVLNTALVAAESTRARSSAPAADLV